MFIVTQSLFSTTVGNNFIYDEGKIDVGSVYIYKTSDYNGKDISYEYVYIKDKNSTEYLRDRYSVGEGLWLEKNSIDKDYFMYNSSHFQTLLSNDDEYTKESRITYDFPNKKGHVKRTRIVKGKEKKRDAYWDFGKDTKYPFYTAGNNVSELNIFLRFINLNKKNVEFGISDVWDKITNYRVIYDGEEVVNGIRCKRYNLNTKGLFAKAFNKTGSIWIKKDDPKQIMVKYMLNQRISSTKKNDMVVLEDIKKMTYTEWQEFIKTKESEIESGLGF